MTTNEWTRVTHHEFAHNTGVRMSRGGASLQACVLVLLFAAAVERERPRCVVCSEWHRIPGKCNKPAWADNWFDG